MHFLRVFILKLTNLIGLDPLSRHSDGYIGMHRACWGGEQRHTDTVKAFLEAGVPWDSPAVDPKTGKAKLTPLQMVEQTHLNLPTRKLLEE